MTHPVLTAKSSSHCTLHTAQCTLQTAPAPANARECEHVHFILNIEHSKLHTCLYWIYQIYHFTLHTSKIWFQDLYGKMYLDVARSILKCSFTDKLQPARVFEINNNKELFENALPYIIIRPCEASTWVLVKLPK